MEEFTEQKIQEAIQAARSGDKETARKILSQVVRSEPNNARAWYLLSQVIEDDEKAVFCLEQVLKIDPNNTQARERLEKYRPEPVNVEEVTNWETYWQDDHQPEQSIYASSKPVEEKGGYGTMILLIVIIVVVLCCLCGVAGAYWFGNFSTNLIEDSINVAPSGPHTVKYRVEGSAGDALVSFTDATGSLVQKTYRLPWETTFRTQSDSMLTLSAQGTGGSGNITCIVYLDGKEWERNASSELIPMCNVFVLVGGE